MIKLNDLLNEVSVKETLQSVKEFIKSLPSNTDLDDLSKAINKTPKGFKGGFFRGFADVNGDFKDRFTADPFNFKKNPDDIPTAYVHYLSHPSYQPTYFIMQVDKAEQKKAIEWQIKNDPRHKGYKFEKLNSKLYGYEMP
jgi:hypothetical protein